MAQKPLTLGTTGIEEVSPVIVSAGAADGNKLVSTDTTGKIDSSVLPNGIGADTANLPASENLSAGDLVNWWNDAGTTKMRKADGATGKRADGFVKAAVTSGATGTCYGPANINDQVTGLTGGSVYYLSVTVPGAVQTTISTTSGHLVQEVGKASAAGTLFFNPRVLGTRA